MATSPDKTMDEVKIIARDLKIFLIANAWMFRHPKASDEDLVNAIADFIRRHAPLAIPIGIENAPKDGTKILACMGGYWTVASWDDDRYGKKPRPYWSSELGRVMGVTWERENQPTHWMPLPAPPTSEGNAGRAALANGDQTGEQHNEDRPDRRSR